MGQYPSKDIERLSPKDKIKKVGPDKKAPLGSGERFASIQNKAAASYEKKGVSPEKAKEIGGAIAAKIGREKYDAKKFSKLSAMARAK